MCVRVCARKRAHDHDLIFSFHPFQSGRNLRFYCPSIINSVEGHLLPYGVGTMTPSLQQRLDQLAHEIGRLRRRAELGCYAVGGAGHLKTGERSCKVRALAQAGLSRVEIAAAVGVRVGLLLSVYRDELAANGKAPMFVNLRPSMPSRRANTDRVAIAHRPATRPDIPARPILSLRIVHDRPPSVARTIGNTGKEIGNAGI